MRPSGRIPVPDVPAVPRGALASSAATPTARHGQPSEHGSPSLQSSVAHPAWQPADSFHFSLPDAFTNSLNFAPPEHRGLGDAATGNEVVRELCLGDGTTLSFGDVVALSGDYFKSVDQIRQLAATDEGRAELRWARWFALSRQSPEPDVAAKIKQRVRTRYLALVADNSGHFSAGGTAIANYQRGHAEALRKAREAGATGNDALFAAAVTDEACCQHFLSDCFSAGHVRTPIIAIRKYYKRKIPDSIKKILEYVAGRVAQALVQRGDVPWFWPTEMFQKKVLQTIERTAGKVVESFSLGDIVALSCHNSDGNGLNVVSDVDASGTPVAGGFHWRAFGDNRLVRGSTTWNMAVAAMRASRAELDQARSMGARGMHGLPTPRTARFIPRNDKGRNPAIAWRWGSMDEHMVAAIDTCLREQLLGELRRNAPNPAIQHYNSWGQPDPKGSVVLHVGDAFEAFCRELEADGTKVLERAIGKPAAPLGGDAAQKPPC